MKKSLNVYGDKLIENSGCGSDIASQRMDDLDRAALDLIAAAVDASSIPVVLDAGAGRCGHANRMSAAGAIVHAVDYGPYAEFAASGTNFYRLDLSEFLESTREEFNIVYCQRTLHYFPNDKAKSLLRQMYRRLEPEGYLLVSASGLTSELGDGYEHRSEGLWGRYAPLAEVMQQSHGIREPVCLYTLDELQQTVIDAGFTVCDGFRSTFGNVKCIAQKRR